MGCGASVPDKLDEAACKTLAGDKFDQAKFDELKDAEGCITKEQLVAAMPTEEATPDASVEAAATPAAEAAAAVPTTDTAEPAKAEEEAAAPAPAAVEPVTIGLKGLPVAIEAAKSKGLTPLIIDSSEDHKVDTFFGYSGDSVMDAKGLGLSVAKAEEGAKDAKKAENLEVARQKLVHAMKKGLNIYVSMQQASPPFNDWLSNDESFPALEVFTNCGASLRAKESKWPETLFKAEDTADTAGIALCDEKFGVILSTWFDKDSYAEFLFNDGFGLSKFPPGLFQPIIIEPEA